MVSRLPNNQLLINSYLMSGHKINRERFKFNGGWPCLDFTNTRNWHSRAPAFERFLHYTDLIRWAEQAGLLGEIEAEGLRQQAAREPAQAAAVFEAGLALRETIYQLFAPVAAGARPDPAALAELNRWLAVTLPHRGLLAVGEGFAWGWLAGAEALERPLWPVIYTAAELLASDGLYKVGKCAGPSCGWLFLDLSRNGSRRWCAMNDCGNRAKAHRHYRRSRGN
jgi:predicted RNA-binding Zn ribbon-like protein